METYLKDEEQGKQSNDVHSETFESRMDPYFTLAYREDKYGRYSTWDKDQARSALATTRPAKHWAQGILGVRSPATKS